MFRLLITALIFLTVAASLAAAKPLVMAFHYGWYGTPARYGSWYHWNQAGHNPDKILPNGMPDTATADHPFKLYDSNDPALVANHLKLAQDAGIDVFIESFARGGLKEQSLRILLDQAKSTPVKVALYYESPVRLNGSQDLIANAVDDFTYMIETYGNNPAYLRVDGKPVIFVYGRAVDKLRGKWQQVLTQVKAKHDVIVVGDSLVGKDLDTFDAIHIYNPLVWITQKRDINRSAQAYVDAARTRGRIATLTVIPGYDDSNLGRKNPIVVPRDNGNLYRRMWSAALVTQPDWVIICSFNEWHEGTEIEPSREYGDLYIKLTKEYSAAFKAGKRSL